MKQNCRSANGSLHAFQSYELRGGFNVHSRKSSEPFRTSLLHSLGLSGFGAVLCDGGSALHVRDEAVEGWNCRENVRIIWVLLGKGWKIRCQSTPDEKHKNKRRLPIPSLELTLRTQPGIKRGASLRPGLMNRKESLWIICPGDSGS